MSKLDRMLEPGEQVLCRDPSFWVPHRWVLFIALAIPWYAVSEAFHLSGGVLLVFYMALFWISYGFGSLGTETLLTERRVLHKGRGENSARVNLPLELVTKIEVRPCEYLTTVKLTKTDGQCVELFNLHRPQPFALALAEAAGVARPALIGPLIHILPHRYLFFGAPAGIFFAVKAYNLLDFRLSDGFWEQPALWSALAVAMLAAGLLGGLLVSLFSGLASYAVLRPLVTFDEARTAVCLMSEAQYQAVYGRRIGRFLEQVYFKWVGLLYAQPIRREAVGPRGD